MKTIFITLAILVFFLFCILGWVSVGLIDSLIEFYEEHKKR